jgi:replicative DNA helicase
MRDPMLIRPNLEAREARADVEYRVVHATPPSDIEAEAAVLGMSIVKPEIIPSLLGTITTASFWSIPHQRIWEAVEDAFANSGTCDLVAVSSFLRTHSYLEEVGGVGYITEICNSTPILSGRRFTQLVDKLADKKRLREVVKICNTILLECNRNQDDAAATIRESFVPTLQATLSSGDRHSGEGPVSMFAGAEAAYNALLAGDGPAGIPTGIRALDQLTGGLFPKEVTIVAARPGYGKTALLGSILANVAECGEPSYMFSLEMGAEQIVSRTVCGRARIDISKPRTRTLTPDDMASYARAMDHMKDWPMWVDDTSALTMEQMIERAIAHNNRIARQGKRLKVVGIDYVQLCKAKINKDANSESQLAHISGMAKMLAKELNVAVVLLSQLNRSIESDGREDPRMSDLRGSGALEQDADAVSFLIPAEPPTDHAPQRVSLVFKKCRHGPVGEVPLLFERQFCSFAEV